MKDHEPVYDHEIAPLLARHLRAKDRAGGDWDEWPAPWRVREMPRPAGAA